MAIINPYDGLGAGRAISESDDRDNDEHPVRKQPVVAKRRAEQEWLRSRLQEQTPRPDVSPQQTMPKPEKKLEGELNPIRWSQPPLPQRRSPLQASGHSAEALTMGADETLSSAIDLAAIPAGTQPSTQEPDRTADVYASASATEEHAQSAKAAAAAERLVNHPDPGPALESLLLRLREPVGRMSAPQVLVKLADIGNALRSPRMTAVSPREREWLHAHLDFLEGYYEGEKKPTPESTKILALMQEIRAQLAIASDAGMAAAVLRSGSLAMSAQAGRMTAPPGPTGQRNVAAKSRNRVLDDGSGTEEAELAEAAIRRSAPGAVHAPVRMPPSSLGKDAEKRREETPVSVVVRSV